VLVGALVLGDCVQPAPTIQPTSTATLEVQFTDRSILTSQPCAPPCWYGLELNKSSKAEAIALVQNLPFIDSSKVADTSVSYFDIAHPRGLEGHILDFNCRQPARQTCVELLFVNEILKEAYLAPNYPLTFSDIVASLGRPDYVRYFSGSSSEPEHVGLLWKARGILLDHNTGQSAPVTSLGNQIRAGKGVDPMLPVDRIEYVVQDDSVLAGVPINREDYPWSGFAQPRPSVP